MALGYSDADVCIDEALVQAAVKRLLASEQIRLSERNRRFLEFVVGETLAGRGDRIKAYCIGVDVFGRGEEFDPNSDPIVRIEATRLRAALATYYSGAGHNESVRIVMRPGSYAPAFEMTNNHIPSSNPVEVFPPLVVEHATPTDEKSAYAHGTVLVDAIVKKLVASGNKVFLGLGARKWQPRKSPPDLDDIPNLCELSVSVHEIAEGKRYTWLLSNLAVGEVRHIDHADLQGHNAPSAGTINEVADRVVASIQS